MELTNEASLLVTTVGESSMEREITLGLARMTKPAPFVIVPTVLVIVADGIDRVKTNCCKVPDDVVGDAPSVFRFDEVTVSVSPAVEKTV